MEIGLPNEGQCGSPCWGSWFCLASFWRAELLESAVAAIREENDGFLVRRSSLRIIEALYTGLLGHNYVLFPMLLSIRTIPDFVGALQLSRRPRPGMLT